MNKQTNKKRKKKEKQLDQSLFRCNENIKKIRNEFLWIRINLCEKKTENRSETDST